MAILAALVAGFGATVVLSALMLTKQSMNVMPELDMIGMISTMMKTSRTVGWVVHFMVGTVVYGIAFVLLAPFLWGDAMWIKGVVLGIIGWLIAMTALMPMAGKGFFGMNIGVMAPIMSLMMHVVFGGLLGWIYGLLVGMHAVAGT